MAKTAFASVAEYIAAQPAPTRRALRRVRAALRRALPGAEEVISYSIPAYRLDGRLVIYFAGWKAHYSLYPVSQRLIARLPASAASYEVNDKGTIRFPLDHPVPAAFIERIARLRARDAAAARAVSKASRARR